VNGELLEERLDVPRLGMSWWRGSIVHAAHLNLLRVSPAPTFQEGRAFMMMTSFAA
jgi:hypothetical protein